MRIGISMCSYAYSENRHNNITRSLNSLAKTNLEGLEKPVLRIVYKPASFDYTSYFELLSNKFDFRSYTDPPGYVKHILYQNEGLQLVNEFPDVTHLTFMPDDWIVNSEWLQELVKLISRHPDAKAWSVFRSAYTEYHRVIATDGTDCLMTMHDGFGCVTREEWIEFGKSGWGGFPDMNHAINRPGERWATGRDYIQQICPANPSDHAIDFVGESV